MISLIPQNFEEYSATVMTFSSKRLLEGIRRLEKVALRAERFPNEVDENMRLLKDAEIFLSEIEELPYLMWALAEKILKGSEERSKG